MFGSSLDFIEEMLAESSIDTCKSLIKHFDLPVLLERTLTELYVEGLEIKQIAYRYTVDDRTVKRWKKEALRIAVLHAQGHLRALSLS